MSFGSVLLDTCEEVCLGSTPLKPWNMSFAAATDPTTGTDSLDMCCLAAGAKRSLVTMDKMASYLLCIAVFVQHCQTESLAPLFHFHNFLTFAVSVCGGQILGNAFSCPNGHEALHLLASTLDLFCCCCCRCHDDAKCNQH